MIDEHKKVQEEDQECIKSQIEIEKQQLNQREIEEHILQTQKEIAILQGELDGIRLQENSDIANHDQRMFYLNQSLQDTTNKTNSIIRQIGDMN